MTHGAFEQRLKEVEHLAKKQSGILKIRDTYFFAMEYSTPSAETKPMHLSAKITFSFAFLSAISTASAATIISDDFSSSNLSIGARLTIGAVDWKHTNGGTDWSVSGGLLNNAATAMDKTSEGALLRVFDVGAASLDSFTKLTFSFDYTVGVGTTLYFHAIGLSEGTTLTDNIQLHNTGATGGTIQAQYQQFPIAPRGDFTGTNILNGANNPNGSTAGALTSIIGGAAGVSGTYDMIFDISGYTDINSINDFQYITMGFAANVSDTTDIGGVGTEVGVGVGAITIDNFQVDAIDAIPEPSAFALLLGSAGMLLLTRRRA